MQLIALCKQLCRSKWRQKFFNPQILLIMRLTALLVIIACLHAGAKGFSQNITLSLKHADLSKVFSELKKQSGYYFIYHEDDLKKSKRIDITVSDASLIDVLPLVFKDQPLQYTIENDRYIIIKPKTKNNIEPQLRLPVDISGSIKNERGEPLDGVTITVKGTSQITVSDAKGKFILTGLQPDAILVISSVGYKTLEVSLKGKSVLSIQLEIQVDEIENFTVSSGYQDIPKERATGAFTKIDNKTLNQQVGASILNRLDGVASGVLFPKQRLQNGPDFMIRGLSTINGPKSPLIVVDNFPYDGDINNINPNDVESITLLKDAAASSIWGVRAGNGVVVITTKKGRFNQPLRVNVNTNVIITQEPDLSLLRVISPSDYIDVETLLFGKGFYNSYLNNTSNRPAVSPIVEILAKRKAGLITPGDSAAQVNAYRNLDIRDQYTKYLYQQAVTQQYAVNLNGGSGNIAYYLSVGYDKSANELSANNDRLTIRSENSYKPFKNLLISLGVQYTQASAITGKPAYGAIQVGQWKEPYLQFADNNGNAVPVASILREGYTDTAGAGKLLSWKYYPLDDWKYNKTKSHQQDLLANIGLDYQFFKELSIDVKYLYERQTINSRSLQDVQGFATRDLINRFSQLNGTTGVVKRIVPLGGILSLLNNTLESQNVRAQINYSHTWGRHNVTAIAGSEIRQAHTISNSSVYYGYNDNTLVTSNVDLANTYPTFINGSYSGIGGSGSLGDATTRYVSFYGNAAYTYNNKYTASVSGRRDASNIFGVNTNNKWNPLWSVGGAWDIGDESFYKLSWLPYLKFRATYGFSGNTNPGMAGVLTLFNANIGPPTNFDISLINNFPNPELKWETVRTINFGIDFQSKKQIITGSLDLYYKKGTDLYGAAPFDPTAGLQLVPTVTRNVADMKGKGIDIAINSINIDKTFKWYSTALFNYNSNRTTNYYIDSNLRSASFVNNGFSINPLIGKPLYSIVAYQWAGLDANGNPQGYWNKQVSTDYYNIVNNTPKEDLIYKSALPVFFGSFINSFTYKGFTLTANINYRLGYYFMKPTINYTSLFNNGAAIGTSDFSKRWQKAGDEKTTRIPSLIYPANGNRDLLYTSAEINMLKADNIKLQYVNLSYDFDKTIWRKMPLQQLQVYVNASNLGVLWKANKENIDPDYISTVPLGKSYAVGLRASFF